VRYERALAGRAVRARGDGHGSGFRGVVGSVLRCYGEREYLAVEVVAKDGRSRVFWHHEVEEEVEALGKRARPRARTW
jgi:hypothetical protein